MEYLKLIASVGICLLVGLIAGLFTSASVNNWYSTLAKPSFSPPNWLFGPVWTLLYILMGISLYLVWTARGSKTVLIIFAVQLALNFAWSFLFFSMKNPLAAFIDIVLLLFMIVLTTVQFYPISRAASYLMVPYILWVSFATVLNYSIYWLNR